MADKRNALIAIVERVGIDWRKAVAVPEDFTILDYKFEVEPQQGICKSRKYPL